jgi:hypothetical protein
VAVEFSILPKADHIRVEISGMREAGRYVRDMVSGWSLVANECRARSSYRILGINRLNGPVPTADAFEIAMAIPPLFRGTPVKLAQVVLGDDESKSANRFAEDVTVNRGMEARNFGDEGAALAWLLDEA